MACIVMAYIVMACIVMAYIVMACIVMAYLVMAYIVMAYIVIWVIRGLRSWPKSNLTDLNFGEFIGTGACQTVDGSESTTSQAQ